MNHNGFILKAKQVVLANLSNEHFGVKSLANEMAVSRSELYKLIKKETRKSATQFIREIKLEKALELLKEHEYPISDVSYMVGFGSPAYFTKRFKEYYGFLPSDTHLLHQYTPDQEINIQKKPSFFFKRKMIVWLVGIIVLSLISAFAFWNWNTLTTNNSIAVLPFEDLSQTQDQAYFSDGLSEAVINKLTQNDNFRVIGKTSSFYYKDKNVMMNEIGKKLDVKYVLNGSVRRLGEYYQITVQLIYTKNGLQIWSQTFESESRDPFKAQEELAQNVVEELEFILL
ncbi:helix-turn-helix domain-containing protein [Flagellimonas zhangzhouensis]|uniref:TolB amino-terminal domain-containing protein n=1 Tax=Flagellimonas zhangzhouensis TaxID=1073328 RepID=A0A1H2X2Z9_9FLAO|nr:helix-turn-helix domain-containing protein [Allomuricauda zhangzhouensis]SDQ27458.1 TolB amino-terminal domain-containing protein [Allomuricauda zhangzhouensis]SDW87157.1 TolB amino-terminal domain-containing protein [Allomuricauda zhangzhouensis]